MKELRTLADLQPDPHNANKGTKRGLDLLERSIERNGLGRSVLADRNGVLIAGNKTTERVADLDGDTELVVVKTNGRQLVVVQRDDLDMSDPNDPRARELAIADNRVADVDLDWDAEALLNSGVDLKAYFFPKELDELFAEDPATAEHARKPEDHKYGDDEAATDSDAGDGTPKAEQVSTDIKPGELFQLGAHVLLCGDSTNPADVARVMRRDKAVLMNTDPPYGVDYVATKAGIPGSGFANIQERHDDVENDELTNEGLQAFLETVIRAAVPHLKKTCAFYLWHPMLTQGTFFAAAAAAAAADVLIHRQIIWVKPGFVLTRSGMYHWKHELCFFGWVKGHPPPWYGDKNQTSVWEVGRDADAGAHPTQKPIELFRRPICNHALRDEVIYEPFSGSGSQILAAEELRVSCRAIELDPRYVQVAIDRWEAFTGQRAERVA